MRDLGSKDGFMNLRSKKEIQFYLLRRDLRTYFSIIQSNKLLKN